MQITVRLPDKIGKKFKKKYTPTQQEKRIKEMVEKDVNGDSLSEKDPFIEWLMKPAKRKDKSKDRNVSENHDEYIYS